VRAEEKLVGARRERVVEVRRELGRVEAERVGVRAAARERAHGLGAERREARLHLVAVLRRQAVVAVKGLERAGAGGRAVVVRVAAAALVRAARLGAVREALARVVGVLARGARLVAVPRLLGLGA